METYAGSQPEGPYIVSEFGQDVILRLVHPIPGTIQNIASNNWDTSFPLAEELLKESLTIEGTAKKNKAEPPQPGGAQKKCTTCILKVNYSSILCA